MHRLVIKNKFFTMYCNMNIKVTFVLVKVILTEY
jgi:hypothetical protein